MDDKQQLQLPPCDTCNGQGWFPVQFFTQDYGYQILKDSCIDCHGTGIAESGTF
jgi:DnaJ-class molecular chaperone